MGRPVTPHNSNSQQSRAGMPVQSATETAKRSMIAREYGPELKDWVDSIC
jgi:hypothetical protein